MQALAASAACRPPACGAGVRTRRQARVCRAGALYACAALSHARRCRLTQRAPRPRTPRWLLRGGGAARLLVLCPPCAYRTTHRCVAFPLRATALRALSRYRAAPLHCPHALARFARALARTALRFHAALSALTHTLHASPSPCPPCPPRRPRSCLRPRCLRSSSPRSTALSPRSSSPTPPSAVPSPWAAWRSGPRASR